MGAPPFLSEGVKSIIEKADSTIKWTILDKLKVNNQKPFVEKYILEILEKSNDDEERGKAIEMLVSLQNMQGLKAYVERIKKNVVNDIETNLAVSLNNLKTIEATPFLLELLELSYIREIKVDMFDSLNSQVLGALNNIALVSENNFQHVKSKLQEFMVKKSSVHGNVKYILHTIERMEEQFYMNRAQSFTIKQVKEKLELF